MPTKEIPINWGLNKAVDEVGLKGYGAALQDCFVDEEGNVHRRPGLVELCDLSTDAPIDGLYWWLNQEWAIGISNGETYKITESDGTYSQISGDAFQKGNRVIFGDYGSALYAANGAKILKIPSSGNVAELTDVDAPTAVTHPVVLDTYLLANEVGSRKEHYSKVGEPENWEGNYVSAEAKTDNLIAVISENLELYFMCETSLENWRDDGETPFVRELQGYVFTGSIAKYSFTMCGGVLYWLDHERNVVRMEPNSRTPQVLSVSMNKYIQGFSVVNDAMGDYIVTAGRPYYVLTFPTEEKTLVWDIINGIWYEWGYWDTGNAEYKNWMGNCHCLATTWNMTLIGSRSTGKIYKLDPSAYDDDGDILRTLIRTIHVDWGTTSVRKQSNILTFKVKRTNVVDQASVTSMTVRWRDDGSSTWKNERTVALNDIGDTKFRGILKQNGAYYSRQYEFVLSDDTPLCLASVQETFDYLNA